MPSSSGHQAPSAGRVNIRDQLAAIHDPLFPFSSPNIDDHSSYRSSRTNRTFQSGNPSNSSPSASTWTDNETGSGSDWDESISRRYQSSKTTWDDSMNQSFNRHTGIQKKRKPGLQIVTDFSKSSVRTGNIVFDQVAAKQPKHGKNRARSIVSQRGISVIPSPLYHKKSINGLPNFRGLVNSGHETRSRTREGSTTIQQAESKTHGPSQNRSSVVFGLCIPKNEAPYHHQGDILESAVTLVTPLTPQIVVTPADEEPRSLPALNTALEPCGRKETGSPTSLYSRSASQFYQQTPIHYASSPPPPPPRVPAQYSSLSGLQNEISLEKEQHMRNVDISTANTDLESKRRLSSGSKDQILPDSCDTARPKSQGWWNLMLSPMLSRAGTLKIIGAQRKKSIPPVPPVPTDPEKTISVGTPETEFSPETPRRLGLASARISTWSRWSHWEREREALDDQRASLENPVPAIPRDYLEQSQITKAPIFTEIHEHEGLAAEYYHACAVEQLACVTYFDCINHSCAEHLPKLRSIFDEQTNKSASTFPSVIGDGLKGTGRAPVEDLGQRDAEGDESEMPSGSGHMADTPTEKSDLVTPMETEANPEEFVSPNVRQASTATFSKPKTIQSREPSPAPVSSSQLFRKEVNAKPATLDPQQSMVESPGPISPDATRALAPAGATPLAPLHAVPESTIQSTATATETDRALIPPPAPQQFFYYPAQQNMPHPIMVPPSQPYYLYPQESAFAVVPSRSIEPQPAPSTFLDEGNKVHEENSSKKGLKDATERDRKKEKTTLGKKKSVFGGICCLGQSRKAEPKRKCQYITATIILVLVIILCIVLAMTLRRRDIVTPIESQWLNLTGYPPVPTGISTVARPNLVASSNECVQPNTLWSCSLSKEDQSSILPNDPDQPNFRFQIRFRNGTVPTNMTIPLNKRADDPSADDLFVPNPTPPNQLDQIFLGNTTDNVTQPFDGEVTPFFITFMSSSLPEATANNTTRLRVRQTSGNDALDSIPPPDIGSDGSAAPVSLLPTTPFPISQPVKLYNRGLNDEHFGFYIYYDKSIFLSGITLQNGSAVQGNLTGASGDQNGGSTKETAKVRCTWAQTRFIVKIYTNPAFGASLLAGSPINTTSSQQNSNGTSSATDFSRPGSFPYPVTIALDRHGGNVNKKITYCYGMQSNGDIENDEKILVSEIRSAGGTIINPSPLLLSGDSSFNSSLGGIDGGTGGCGCTWQNWT